MDEEEEEKEEEEEEGDGDGVGGDAELLTKKSVMEIFQTMKESARDCGNWQAPPKSHVSAASLTSLCPDISPSNSMFFEVLYVGKIKVSHRNVPDTFIDDALEKIKLQVCEMERARRRDNGYCKASSLDASARDSVPRVGGDRAAAADKPKPLKASFSHDDIRAKVPSREEGGDGESAEELGYQRARAGSLSVIDAFRKRTDATNHNRTMLFYVGRTDLRLISPDRKQVIFHEKLRDIVSCVQGVTRDEHFGFICREVDSYVGYIFKCESESVAANIVSVITQSFQSARESREKGMLSCEHCPMLWFHNLCAEVEGLKERKKVHGAILRRIETLPADEQRIIRAKYMGTESSNVKEQNEFLMILLRTHCETKQARHVHDTAENRSEFLQQYLGGSTIFMKAKRSLTSSFDQLLKRRGSQLDAGLHVPKESRSLTETDGAESCSGDGNDAEDKSEERSRSGKPTFQDIAAITINNRKIEKAIQRATTSEETAECKTPMLNIFLKVGSTTSSPATSDERKSAAASSSSRSPDASWRQAIFDRVVSPPCKSERCGATKDDDDDDDKRGRRRTRDELRDLWRKAIHQQLLLIRMEKENARLKERQEEATVKRIKLEYDELASLSKEYMGIWDLISSKDRRLIASKCDDQVILQAIRQGVPPAKRGDVWHFLAAQYCRKQPPFDSSAFPNYDVHYEDLLKQLTSFQHAILIDLGRTFPNHPYFSSPLGPGQLALFNLLKAYSLLDPQVGYCQGLSFIAGVLLLHMSEEAAFVLLRHLMFRRGIRRQYLPDMAALQVQLYQLTRLLYDTLPRLYAHFDRNEIAPTLYAAPWMLTLFASQFPLGFVTRVFDLIFLERTTDIIFRVILALLEEHMESLLACSTFEEIMSYLKNDTPKMIGVQVEKIMKRVFTMDISKRLREYEVEYHVLQEEMSTPRPKLEELKKLELENKRLTDQNLALLDQLELVNKNSSRLEKSRSTQQSVINRLETQVRNLEITIATLGEFIADACEACKEIEVPGDVRRIMSSLELTESATTTTTTTTGGKQLRFDAKRKSGEESKEGEYARRDRTKGSVLRGGASLKVIADEDDDKSAATGSNLTTKITSGVSSFFGNAAQSQGKGNGNKSKRLQGNAFVEGAQATKDSAARKDKGKREGKSPRSADADAPADGGGGGGVRFHPLDACADVNITYNGTAKLKSIKSPAPKMSRSNATIYCE